MKVFVNRKPVDGPWGGGNKTLKSLVSSLSDHADIVYDLDHNDIDVLFCMDPRPDNSGVWYQDLLNYRDKFGAKIVQRVGDVGSHGKPDLTQLVHQSSNLSDFLIFPSDWARKSIRFEKKNYSIIYNSPLQAFYGHRKDNSEIVGKLRVITHHWSNNTMKGFDIYERLGEYCKAREDIEFTYIGRYSGEFSSDGINVVEPKDVDFLIEELPKHDVYLTASRFEAGANHVLEGLAAGLPVVYRTGGGSIDEYCSQYGLEYSDFDSLISCLSEIQNNSQIFKRSAMKFDREILQTIDRYVDVILKA